MVGVEALLRWDNPVLGSVSPARFIPVAEEAGLIRPIGAWVLQQACWQLAQWHAQGFTSLTVSVNLSALQLADTELVAQIQQCLQDHGIAPAALELEITESVLMDNTSLAVEQLAALKALGVQLSIDDFGTGYSSLAYLKRFAIDKLKIDQSFVRDMLTDPTDLAIIRAIIALGHTLGLKIVAEGVELASSRPWPVTSCKVITLPAPCLPMPLYRGCKTASCGPSDGASILLLDYSCRAAL